MTALFAVNIHPFHFAMKIQHLPDVQQTHAEQVLSSHYLMRKKKFFTKESVSIMVFHGRFDQWKFGEFTEIPILKTFLTTNSFSSCYQYF